MHARTYEVCLLTSSIRSIMPDLRRMLSPLDGLHPKTFDCVEVHYSGDRDALLLRLSFSAVFSTRHGQVEIVRLLEQQGFDILESSELSDAERPRFDELLHEQYTFRLQQYPSIGSPSPVERILEALQGQLGVRSPHTIQRAAVASRPARRLSTIDAFDQILAELPLLETEVDGFDSDPESRKATEVKLREHAKPALGGGAEALPLRMETFGALDDMIASLPRAKTQESLDAVLDSLWP